MRTSSHHDARHARNQASMKDGVRISAEEQQQPSVSGGSDYSWGRGDPRGELERLRHLHSFRTVSAYNVPPRVR